MNYQLHFLRPHWFLALIPLLLLGYMLLRQKPIPHAWHNVCDKHLLPHLIHIKGHGAQKRAFGYLLAAALCMIISLTGPAGKKLPTPTYHAVHPRLILLDLSQAMLKKDLTPNRLTRAKFKLHDLFQYRDKGQFGLIVYTGEPFVVSPLTLDAQTIDTLVDQLDPGIMPVGGTNLADALKEGGDLIKQSGATYGDLLVLTGTAPTKAAILAAKKLQHKHLRISILPLTTSQSNSASFKAFANAGDGQVIHFTNTESDIKQWLAESTSEETLQESLNNTIPLWRDDGRWFLIPAGLFLLPVFRRFWLMRIQS
ncbi:MAG: VWA domain-containing protein [Legionellaceae bacterium]|nr:VWA domain-containing protein [Legionellaceae bacterium]